MLFDLDFFVLLVVYYYDDDDHAMGGRGGDVFVSSSRREGKGMMASFPRIVASLLFLHCLQKE